MTTGTNATATDIPREQIEAISGQCSECLVKVSRQLHTGHWNALNGSGQSRPTADMIHPEGWLEENWGGGNYRVTMFDPTRPALALVPAFMVRVEGLPKAKEAQNAQDSHQQVYGGGFGVPQAPQRPGHPQAAGGQPALPMWPYGPFQGMPSALPPQYYDPADYGHPNPGQGYWTETPDAIASQQTSQLREDLKAEREEHKRERREAESRMNKLADELTKTRADNDKALFEAKLEAIRAEARGSQQQQRPPLDVVGLATAIVPVVTAIITASTSRADVNQRKESTAIEVQSKTFTAVIESMKKTDDGSMLKLVLGLAPILAPIVIKYMAERSPSAQMEVMSAMTQNQMMGLSTVAQMLDKLSQADNAPPWVGLAVNFIESLQTVAHSYIADKTRKPQQVASQQSAEAEAEPMQHPPAEEIVEGMVKHPQFPQELNTEEWRELLVEIHEHDHDTVRETAAKLAALLVKTDKAKKLPVELRQVMKDSSKIGEMLLFRLPVAQIDADYAQALAERVQVEMAVPADANAKKAPESASA